MTRIRGHHLICMHFYLGVKQEPAFFENMKKVMYGLEQGEMAEVVEGPDDICRGCSSLKGNRCEQAEGADEEIDALDRLAREGLGVVAGDKVNWLDIRKTIHDLGNQWLADICEGCGWKDDCQVDTAFIPE